MTVALVVLLTTSNLVWALQYHLKTKHLKEVSGFWKERSEFWYERTLYPR